MGGPASTTQPSRSPTRGPHISSPGGREATFPEPALPGCGRALWRPPRRRVLGTRGRLSGFPFQGWGPRGGIAELREQSLADRTLSAPRLRASTGTPKERHHGRPSLAWKVPRVAVFRGPLSPRCAPPAASGLSTTLRKNAACMHLFIYFATAARNNEAFSRSPPARSPAALLLFSMKLRGRTPRPPRPQPARPAAAPLATESHRRPGHCFFGVLREGRVRTGPAGAVRVGAEAWARAWLGACAGGRRGWRRGGRCLPGPALHARAPLRTSLRSRTPALGACRVGARPSARRDCGYSRLECARGHVCAAPRARA